MEEDVLWLIRSGSSCTTPTRVTSRSGRAASQNAATAPSAPRTRGRLRGRWALREHRLTFAGLRLTYSGVALAKKSLRPPLSVGYCYEFQSIEESRDPAFSLDPSPFPLLT